MANGKTPPWLSLLVNFKGALTPPAVATLCRRQDDFAREPLVAPINIKGRHLLCSLCNTGEAAEPKNQIGGARSGMLLEPPKAANIG
jgi:hypothetical protein